VGVGDRLWLAGLLMIDRVFGTRLAIKEVARRRQRLAQAEARLATIQTELTRLTDLLEQMNVALCLFHLHQRRLSMPEKWLRFQPSNEDETQILEMLIEHLVKPRLAAVEMQEGEAGYIYQLIPDWLAIRATLENLDPDLAVWLEEMAGR
jgi:hypothetical protein